MLPPSKLKLGEEKGCFCIREQRERKTKNREKNIKDESKNSGWPKSGDE